MSLNSVILAVEDTLSDAVSTKILRHFGIEIHIRIPNTYQGNTYLQRRARELNRSAKARLMFSCSLTKILRRVVPRA